MAIEFRGFMTEDETKWTANPRVDAEALFRKLGLKPADSGPLLEDLRQANAAWRRDRMERIAEHARRVQDGLQQDPQCRRLIAAKASSRARTGKPRAVWCVELKRHFRTLTEAAAFVNRKPSNISQSLQRGVRCGPYHWEEYDAAKHERQRH